VGASCTDFPRQFSTFRSSGAQQGLQRGRKTQQNHPGVSKAGQAQSTSPSILPTAQISTVCQRARVTGSSQKLLNTTLDRNQRLTQFDERRGMLLYAFNTRPTSTLLADTMRAPIRIHYSFLHTLFPPTASRQNSCVTIGKPFHAHIS